MENINEQALTFEETFQLINALAERYGVAINVADPEESTNKPTNQTPTRPKKGGGSKQRSLRATRATQLARGSKHAELKEQKGGLVGRGDPAVLSECWLEHKQRDFMDMDKDGDCRLDADEVSLTTRVLAASL
jgi:hypothetical protein